MFSLWCDFIQKDFIAGQFSDFVKNKIVNGATSNPAIFNEAFKSKAYESLKSGLYGDSKHIYESLAINDITSTANVLLENFNNKNDGFVSIEVDPNLADDTFGTISEGKRLFKAINMPNVMIKIPATNAGFEAMRELISVGINVNATLIFSPKQAENCLDAFKLGTEIFKQNYQNKSLPQAVISIFVSRFDRLLDEKLQSNNKQKGKLGIANATKIYKIIQLSNQSNVRALFASTSVKGNDLPAHYYVSELMYENSINTAPLETIKAFIDTDSKIKEPLSDAEIENVFKNIASIGIDIDSIYDKLLIDGLKSFKEAFADIMNGVG